MCKSKIKFTFLILALAGASPLYAEVQEGEPLSPPVSKEEIPPPKPDSSDHMVSLSVGLGLISIRGTDRNPPFGRVHKVNTDFLQSRLNWNITAQAIFHHEQRVGFAVGTAVMRLHSITDDNFYRSHAVVPFALGTLKFPTSGEMFTVGLGPLVILNIEQTMDLGNTKLLPILPGLILDTKFGLRRSRSWTPFFSFRGTSALGIPQKYGDNIFGVYTVSGNVGIETPF